MAEIIMSDYDTFDENIGDLKSNLSSKEKAEYYFNRLNTLISGEESIEKIKNEVYNFIYVNTLMDAEVKQKLVDIVDSDYQDANKLSNDVINYLKQNQIDKEIEYIKSDEKVEDIKDDFVERIEDNLKNSKVELTGSTKGLKESLDSEKSLDKLNTEVNKVNDVLIDNEEKLELTTNDLVEAVNSPEDNVLTDKIEEQLQEKNNLKITENGIVEIEGNLQNNNDTNYVTMMMTGLIAGMNLDMYLSKDKKNSNAYKVTFGNLPIKNHPENRLDSTLLAKINDISNSYNSTINYKETLSSTDINLSTLNEIVFDEMNEEGTMKVGINNHDGNYIIGINASSEHQNLIDAFSSNGAKVGMDTNENSVVMIDGPKIEQFSILNNTKLTLLRNKEENIELTNNYQYIKKLETPNQEAAKVTPYFLIVIAVTELLIVLLYVGMFLIRK